ncbi:hypothetical protein AALB16_06090 [Lachnospiraceae bacterium 62-35]
MGKNENNNGIIDITGSQTRWEITPKRGFGIGLEIVIFIICCLLPLNHISDTASTSLALVLSVVCLWVTNFVPMTIAALLLSVGALLLKFSNSAGIPDQFRVFGFSCNDRNGYCIYGSKPDKFCTPRGLFMPV